MNGRFKLWQILCELSPSSIYNYKWNWFVPFLEAELRTLVSMKESYNKKQELGRKKINNKKNKRVI